MELWVWQSLICTLKEQEILSKDDYPPDTMKGQFLTVSAHYSSRFRQESISPPPYMVSEKPPFMSPCFTEFSP
jgi:hypothetical protein